MTTLDHVVTTSATPFFATCFSPKRLVGGICLADLVRSWARHHPTADVARAIDRIEELLRSGLTEDRLRIVVLGTARCGFDPGMHGMTMAQWLGLVRGLLTGWPDAMLPEAAWEPMVPWPGQDVGELPSLRELFERYILDQGRSGMHTFEAVVERFVVEAGPSRSAALVRDIDDLLGRGLGEERLRIVVLGRLRCAYDPRPDLPGGRTVAQWLRSVRGAAVSSTVGA